MSNSKKAEIKTVEGLGEESCLIWSFEDFYMQPKQVLSVFTNNREIVDIFDHERTSILLSNILETAGKNIDTVVDLLSKNKWAVEAWYEICTVSYYMKAALETGVSKKDIADRILELDDTLDMDYIYSFKDSDKDKFKELLEERSKYEKVTIEIINLASAYTDDDALLMHEMTNILKPVVAEKYKDGEIAYAINALTDFEFKCFETLSKIPEGILVILSLFVNPERFDKPIENDKKIEREKKHLDISIKNAKNKQYGKYYRLRFEADMMMFDLKKKINKEK